MASVEATTGRKTNAEVARTMLIFGGVFIALAVLLTFTDTTLATYVNHGGVLSSFILHMWSIVVQLGYPLGSFLIVGSIIVNRLPERNQ
ncbi:hypothetical protein [Demequina sp.]|uniref:hypothetical protein n=1 Tax=Demequina sp. TaxID=2050685 RepID=UPI003D10B99B